eukprot:6503950-Pyramimonas_sp.AAC.1
MQASSACCMCWRRLPSHELECASLHVRSLRAAPSPARLPGIATAWGHAISHHRDVTWPAKEEMSGPRDEC